MNKAHAIWTLQPNGFADAERTRVNLSLVVSIRASTEHNRLGDLPELLDWPAQVRVFDTVNVFVDGQQQPVPATVVSDPPGSQLWTALFGPDTVVDLAGGGDVGDVEQAGSSVLYRPLTRALRGIYQRPSAAGPAAAEPSAGPAARASAGGPMQSPLQTALAGLTEWSALAGNGGRAGASAGAGSSTLARAAAPVHDELAELLDPTKATTASMERAAALLREQGQHAAASVVPLIGVIRRLRGSRPGAPAATAAARSPGRLDGTRTVDQADFHQVLGLVSAHPTLAIGLGLRIELTMPALPGEHAIRTSGLPWQLAGGRPWSRVRCDPDTGRFTMASQQDAPTEIVHGMLDLRPDGPRADKYVVTTMDVVGMTEQLDGLARALGNGQAASADLPPRRNVGITIAQVDRRATTVSHTVARGKLLSAGFSQPDSIEQPARAKAETKAVGAGSDGEMVLYADDVTAGYRVDVSTDGGEWRSLMRRLITYTVGRGQDSIVLTADDEGFIDPVVAVEQRDQAGAPVLEVGEDLFSWDGYGLTVRRPGPTLTTAASGQVSAEIVPRQTSEHYPLAMAVAPKPFSLPKLRYGRQYQFRMRAMDLAGNSIDPALCEPGLVSPAVVYRRLDPVAAPEVVPRDAFSAGESLLRLVVRSDGEGNPIGGSCERHLAAPKAGWQLAELHGMFDEAIGTGASQQARDRMLAIGALEAGSFADPTVPDPADPTRRIDAPGIRLVVNKDAPGEPTGSLAGLVRGQPPPAGEYVVHATDDSHLPYLADPLATGFAATGLSTSKGAGPAVVGYRGRWPSISPARLVAKPGLTAALGVATPVTPSGRQVLEVTVPPAATIVTELSSTLDDAGLDLMEIDLPAAARAAAKAGQEPLLTPRRPVTIVHAVQRPLTPPQVTAATPGPRVAGDTSVEVTGTTECHPASTSRIDIVGRWNEVLDDGVSALVTEQRTATAGSVTVTADAATVSWTVRHTFGDTKRRDITCFAVASTRFREYFPPSTPREDLIKEGPGVTVVVPNTARPDPPRVHSTVPLFSWERTIASGALTSTRRTVGLRAYLERPWRQTGIDERLGVIVYRNQSSGDRAKTVASVHNDVSRWAGDPLDGWGQPAPHLLAANFPAHIELGQQLPPVPMPSGPPAQLDVLGHAVHYDKQRDQWYADVVLDLDDQKTWFPFVRLAVARYQPASAPGCHVSSIVVLPPIQLPPRRTLTAVATGPDKVELTVEGPWISNNLFEATLYTRSPDPLAAATASDIFVEASSPHGSRKQLTPPQFENAIKVTGTVLTAKRGVPSEELLAGRIVVRELQTADSLHYPGEPPSVQPAGPANRAVWVDVIDRPDLNH